MPRSLTVLLKPQVLQHPDYAKYNPVNLSLNPRPGPSDIGSVFTRNNDRSKYLCYVSIPDIVPFIAAQAEYIEGIKWDILTDPSEKGAWQIDFVNDIQPFDDESFWKFVPHRLQDITEDFVRTYADKLNFGVDETYHVYASQTREYFSVPAKLSLSQRENFPWSAELLEEFADRWNWRLLASNEGIIWNTPLIERFLKRVDFRALSARPDLPWTPELISQYADRWDWQALSGNPGLPWSYELLKAHEERWVWQSKVDYLKYLRGDNYTHLKTSTISHNSGIRWTTRLREFVSKVDVWTIAANAYMSQPFIALVSTKLSESRVIYTYWVRYSDYPLEEEKVELSGWDLIQRNEHKFYPASS